MTQSPLKLPNLLIPGYHKAGTTTLFHQLSKHPDIYPSHIKEPFYFRPYINGKDLPPIADYASNFAGSTTEKYRMEGSPTYIYGGERAASKIREMLGDVRIIISLRNPVDQLFSLYKHHLRFLKIDKNASFLEFLKNKADFQRQFYDEHLEGWFNVFGDSVKCVFFDSLIQTPGQVIADIQAWLEISPTEFDTETWTNTNPGESYRFKVLHQISLGIFNKAKNIIPHRAFVILRKYYFRLNGKANTSIITPESRKYLEPILADHHARLASILSDRGYADLPVWLKVNAEVI